MDFWTPLLEAVAFIAPLVKLDFLIYTTGFL
jgi:hypothetical protein